MNIRIKYHDFASVILTLYFFLIGFITPFNFTGWTPIPLVIMFLVLGYFLLVFLKNGFFHYKSSFSDKLVLLFLLHSFLSVLLNSFNLFSLNYNHLLAHFVVLGCYYFVLKIAFYNSYFGSFKALIFGMQIAFWSISIIGILDYILRLKGVHIEDIIPMPLASPLAGSEIFVRAKGFFIEPTDFGMGLNAFGPIVISYYYNEKKLRLFFAALLTFLLAHIVSRSSSAVAFLLLGMFLAVLANRRLYTLRVSVFFTRFALLVLAAFVFIVIYLYEYLDLLQSELFSKIFLDSSSSSSDRKAAWNLMLEVFRNGNIVVGYGTGYVVGAGLTSLNWYLSVLVENGLIGILIIAAIIIYTLKESLKIQRVIRFGYFISVIAVFGHLFTQSGFYFPFPWTLMAMIPFLKPSQL